MVLCVCGRNGGRGIYNCRPLQRSPSAIRPHSLYRMLGVGPRIFHRSPKCKIRHKVDSYHFRDAFCTLCVYFPLSLPSSCFVSHNALPGFQRGHSVNNAKEWEISKRMCFGLRSHFMFWQPLFAQKVISSLTVFLLVCRKQGAEDKSDHSRHRNDPK